MPKIRAIDKYSYLIGTKVNKWTVLSLEKIGRYTYANCQCECGTIKNVEIQNLVLGYSRDCGCGRLATIKKVCSQNLVGRRFGKFVVLERLDEKDNSNHTLYRCLCDCGKEIHVPSNSLTTGNTTSCGCLSSRGNMIIGQLLRKLNIEHKPEYTVFIDGVKYRFDYYLPQYNLCIEYDGEQHYKPVQFGGQTEEQAKLAFEDNKRRDEIKNIYCETNHIQLLRIPYWESKNLEIIINNHLQRLNEKGYVEQPA